MAWTRCAVFVCVCALVRTQVIPGKARTSDGDYNTVNTDGSFDFGYANPDRGQSYHLAHGNSNGLVGGRFGAKDPATDTVKETIYTAGPRGFRAKGPNVHRKMDLDQRPRGPIGNKDDPYFDPNEDPSYAFKFETRSYSKNENADSRGDVKGHYSYVDDVGERHDVSYIAGRDTGFHVSSAHPDSPNLIGAPFHRSPLVRGETKPRGRTAVQRGLDGSYRFISAGPDQRRTESSDSHGNVRGSYTFLDDKGIQRTVNYIAGPGIGYRIVKNNKDPYIPSSFPTIPSAYDPDFVNAAAAVTNFSPDDSGSDDVFKTPEGTAASGHVKPPPFPSKDKDREGPSKPSSGSPGKPWRPSRPSKPSRPTKKPIVPLKPFKPTNNKDDDGGYDDGTNDNNTPQFAIGFNIHHNRPGTTIIRNIGRDYFGVPPGVSVRAHVQSIDLYPYDSQPLTPSEVMEKDKT
ncbi:uncharacterized protein Cpr73D isoform X2 [Plodia interpunctella]|uniref:uncharacterized protein Cpr73D isoform X2 n=1 Tax=Plodia interpunctella TaxID=58824 RepID=UPI0023683430|nr:uncharacterized protein LOC128671032 isoform X2 [Plodia interpunctella]